MALGGADVEEDISVSFVSFMIANILKFVVCY